MADLSFVYSENARISTTLERSWKFESKTRQTPFVLANEVPVEGTNFESVRQFLVFHDINHFLNVKVNYPHTHEIIRCPKLNNFPDNSSNQKDTMEEDEMHYRDDLCKGRLIFDFDLEEPVKGVDNLPGFDYSNTMTYVPSNFTQVVNHIITLCMSKYYKVDIAKLGFGWQHSPNPKKFSMHLVVKNAYFSEYWPKQMRIFHELFKYVANQEGYGYVCDAIDWQIARRNGTFRMYECSKIGGSPLNFHSYCVNNQYYTKEQVPFKSMMVGIYDHRDMLEEQTIALDNINYVTIGNILDDNTAKQYHKSLRKQLGRPQDIDEETKLLQDAFRLCESDINTISDMFDEFNNENAYVMRQRIGSIFNLQRSRPSECPISGVIHENENPYLIATYTGLLIFKCRRGCTNKHGFNGYVIGTYNQSMVNASTKAKQSKADTFKKPKLSSDVFVPEPAVFNSSANSAFTKTPTWAKPINNTPKTRTIFTIPKVTFIDNTIKSKGNSASLVSVGNNMVQIPGKLRKSPQTQKIQIFI
tara:strand:- start:62391 stop:63977 length:1587 start_codon:yes stop_codon:yes gene_type:complete